MKRFRKNRDANAMRMRRAETSNNSPYLLRGSKTAMKTPVDRESFGSEVRGNTFPTLQSLELEYIDRVLNHVNQNKTKAARILGIDRVSLWRKMKRIAGSDSSPGRNE